MLLTGLSFWGGAIGGRGIFGMDAIAIVWLTSGPDLLYPKALDSEFTGSLALPLEWEQAS